MKDQNDEILPSKPAGEIVLTHRPRQILPAVLLGLIGLLAACTLPAPGLVEEVGPTGRGEAPTLALVAWSGGPTRTPFQPLAPTAILASPAPPTATPVPEPTDLPEEEAKDWPPPNFYSPGPPPVTAVPPPSPLLSGPDTVNFLLLGSDRRASSFRTDTMVIASLRPADGLVTLISIPRDLFVYLPGYTMQRINSAYLFGDYLKVPGGGAALLKDTIRYNLGIRIDHLALVEFDGFIKVVDILEGIDVPLACPYTDWRIINPNLSDQNENNWELYTIGPGLVHMDGEMALWYSRSRLRSTDFDRGRRQQEVLRALYQRGLALDALTRLPGLYKQMTKSVQTDLSLDDLLALVPLAADLGAPEIRSFYINPSVVMGWHTPGGAAVQLPLQKPLRQLLKAAMAPPDKHEKANLRSAVEIWNGTANANWEALAAERLHYAGFETVLAAADRDDYKKTILYNFFPEENSEQSARLAGLLGLSSAQVMEDPEPESPVAFRLILGRDYSPCFDPAKITR